MAKKKASKTKKFEFSKVGSLIDDIAKKTNLWVDDEDRDVERIGTGIYILNALLSGSIYGGIWSDAITVFAGEEATGKSFLAQNIVREAQALDYNIIYIDTENAIRRSDLRSFGIDSSPDKFKLIRSNKVEEINISVTQLLEELKETKKQGYELPKILFVLDSLAQLASLKEKDDLIAGKNKQDMTKAKAIGSMFRSITMDLGYLNIPMIVNNQVYDTMDLFSKTVMKGGKSLYYSASNIVILTKAKYKDGVMDEYDYQSGIKVTAKAEKNRQVIPKKVKFIIEPNRGANKYYGLEMFCTAENFEKVGIGKGKWTAYDKPKEMVDEETGEVVTLTGEFKEGGNRWYVRHLNGYVTKAEFHTAKVFTKEVLDEIDKISADYFKYSSIEEAERYEELFLKKYTENKADDEYLDADLDDLDPDEML